MSVGFLSVIFMNFFGFDMIIFLAAIFNGAVYYFLKKNADRLHGMMNHTIYVPHFHLSRAQTNEQVAKLREEDVIALNTTTGKLYSLFINITGIFPLLGILGTVVSLLGLVSDMENVTGNFYGALTSTFWGLIFAILFKFLDGVIAPGIESNEKSVQIFLEQNSNEDIKAAKPVVPDEPAEGSAGTALPEITEVDIVTGDYSSEIPEEVTEVSADEE